MKSKEMKKRCMDCAELNRNGECWFCDSEDQKACKKWKPALTESQFKAALEDYKDKKTQAIIKKSTNTCIKL